MTKVHYFQRYSSQENTVTNNTLLLFTRIYQYSPDKLSQLLNTLTDEEFNLGIEFTQQTRQENSVPDGALIQRGMKLLVEAKVDSSPDMDQLFRHAQSFPKEAQNVLILLTKSPVDSWEDIHSHFRNKHPMIGFYHFTYEDICRCLDGLFGEYENEMYQLISDYTEYCNDTNLIDQSPFLMRIVPCGQSISINRKYGVYFHPSDRGYRRHSYLGLYKDKAVRVMWKLDSVFDVRYESGSLEKSLVQGRDTDEYDEKIVQIMEEAREVCGWDITWGHRFFCGEPHDTEYVKSSKHGTQGARFVNLKEVLGEVGSVESIARELGSKEWQ